ncbi:Bug family tripartite tricarboxylate transporter substrate binding protein [Diaphorobacter caeni]|uniref:Bug family tripartite tricarboxylate transporter substrate binding protein n=1 Tax=Diaphorobacter caeni TaxID=2784387 RepID=UPI00188E20B5|nr:tripartite tricarboxylate transporter substrate binding protein [Diaphorobacter caeni]MBF5004326.1 tripartite tricarboxylate transporter substrate binding protein [Diaphorobacter caeni]
MRTGRRSIAEVIFATLLCAVSATSARAAPAEDFPSQSIRIVVPFPPGGSTDVIARILAEGMSRELGQSVVVDNRPGAATNIGSDYVARSKADGYTLLFGGSALIVNSIFGPRPSFDPDEALTSVSTVAEVPFMLATSPEAAFRTSREFVDAARSEPGKYSVASAQLDTYVERFKMAAGVDVLHVPYKGGAQAVTDTLSSQVDSAFALVPVVLPQIQAGKLRALGISSAKRLLPTLPEVPTFVENGVNFVMTVWYGVQAPSEIAGDRLDLLNQAVRKVVDAGDFASRLAEMGARAGSSTPKVMDRLFLQQRTDWEALSITHPELVQKP